MKRVIAWIIFIIGLIAVCFAMAEDRQVFILCDPKTPVIIRRSPKIGSEEIGRLDCGDSFMTDDKRRNGFIHVVGLTEYGEGWIFRGYVVDDKPIIHEMDGYIAATGRVARRNYIGGRKTGWLKVCTDLKIYAYSDLWAVTNKGYIKTKYLEMQEK